MQRLILSSKSPRRKELLDLLEKSYDVIVSEVDETINLEGDLRKEIEKLAFRKAQKVFLDNQDATVIGADTIVVINKQVLGKPKDEDDAYRMLKMLSGNSHEVITGVCIIDKNRTDCFSCATSVKFNELSDEEIKQYIHTREPFDKAGAYAIQGKGARYINSIEGDYYTVMGLPIAEVYKRLKKF